MPDLVLEWELVVHSNQFVVHNNHSKKHQTSHRNIQEQPRWNRAESKLTRLRCWKKRPKVKKCKCCDFQINDNTYPIHRTMYRTNRNLCHSHLRIGQAIVWAVTHKIEGWDKVLFDSKKNHEDFLQVWQPQKNCQTVTREKASSFWKVATG